jgi:hypothetical protein
VLAIEIDASLTAQRRPDDLNSFLQRTERLPRGADRTAHRADRVPDRARAQTELEAAAAELIQGGGRLGQHRRRPQGKTGDVGKDAHPAGLGQNHGH